MVSSHLMEVMSKRSIPAIQDPLKEIKPTIDNKNVAVTMKCTKVKGIESAYTRIIHASTTVMLKNRIHLNIENNYLFQYAVQSLKKVSVKLS